MVKLNSLCHLSEPEPKIYLHNLNCYSWEYIGVKNGQKEVRSSWSEYVGVRYIPNCFLRIFYRKSIALFMLESIEGIIALTSLRLFLWRWGRFKCCWNLCMLSWSEVHLRIFIPFNIKSAYHPQMILYNNAI